MSDVRVGVGVFVFHDGKFLMGKRRNSHGHDTWSIPGGHMEFGESFEDTAKREVLEETGIQINNVRFGAVTNDRFESEGKHYVTIWMLSDLKYGTPTILEPDKFTEMAWRDFDSLPEPLFLPWVELIKSQFYPEIRKLASTL